MSFKEEPWRNKIFIFCVCSAGVLFLFFNLPERSLLNWQILFFILLHIILEHLDVPLPRGQGFVSVSFVIDLAMILLFGPAIAAWTSFSTLLHFRELSCLKKDFHRAFFNASQMVLSAGVAGYVYLYTGGTLGQIELPLGILPVIFSVGTYFLINSTLVMTVITLSQGRSFVGVWLTIFRWGVPNYFATSPLGVLIAVVYVNIGMSGVLLLIIPLMVARHTFIMYMDMRNQYLSTIKALTKAIDAKDHYTHGHSERVAQLAVMIGQEMRMPEDFLEKLEYLALMHDIGKIGVPENILNKPSRLSDEEYTLVQGHSAVGADIIKNIKYIGEYADVVRHHHERLDGRGYPDGLRGDKVSLGAGIVGVADAFDAMTTERVYREPVTKLEAANELRRCSGSQFNPDVVAAFIRVMQRMGEI